MKSESISVDFEVECDEFRVPAMPGLDFGAIYSVIGEVTPDSSGDLITPDGPPDVDVSLGEVKSYTIAHEGTDLPDWLQEHLAIAFAGEMDAAFLQAIGGQDKLNQFAVDKVFG